MKFMHNGESMTTFKEAFARLGFEPTPSRPVTVQVTYKGYNLGECKTMSNSLLDGDTVVATKWEFRQYNGGLVFMDEEGHELPFVLSRELKKFLTPPHLQVLWEKEAEFQKLRQAYYEAKQAYIQEMVALGCKYEWEHHIEWQCETLIHSEVPGHMDFL